MRIAAYNARKGADTKEDPKVDEYLQVRVFVVCVRGPFFRSSCDWLSVLLSHFHCLLSESRALHAIASHCTYPPNTLPPVHLKNTKHTR